MSFQFKSEIQHGYYQFVGSDGRVEIVPKGEVKKKIPIGSRATILYHSTDKEAEALSKLISEKTSFGSLDEIQEIRAAPEAKCIRLVTSWICGPAGREFKTDDDVRDFLRDGGFAPEGDSADPPRSRLKSYGPERDDEDFEVSNDGYIQRRKSRVSEEEYEDDGYEDDEPYDSGDYEFDEEDVEYLDNDDDSSDYDDDSDDDYSDDEDDYDDSDSDDSDRGDEDDYDDGEEELDILERLRRDPEAVMITREAPGKPFRITYGKFVIGEDSKIRPAVKVASGWIAVSGSPSAKRMKIYVANRGKLETYDRAGRRIDSQYLEG